MSIATISSAFSSSLPTMVASVATEAAVPVRALPRVAREDGRSQELIAEMNRALGIEGGRDRTTEQAVLRFAHALVQDLRTMVGDEGNRPRPWGDLSQRLGALATAASQVNGEAPSPETLDQPRPLTPTTAALHIMNVPSSHLLEAFVSMQRALGQQSDDSAPSNARKALADLVRRLTGIVAPTATAVAPAGSVLDASA